MCLAGACHFQSGSRLPVHAVKTRARRRKPFFISDSLAVYVSQLGVLSIMGTHALTVALARSKYSFQNSRSEIWTEFGSG